MKLIVKSSAKSDFESYILAIKDPVALNYLVVARQILERDGYTPRNQSEFSSVEAITRDIAKILAEKLKGQRPTEEIARTLALEIFNYLQNLV